MGGSPPTLLEGRSTGTFDWGDRVVTGDISDPFPADSTAARIHVIDLWL